MARRFTREEKLNHIAIWKASGLNRKDYATSKGIKEDTFYRWIYEMQSLSEIIQKQKKETRAITLKYIRAMEELKLQLAHRFARHSEKYYPGQPSLFDELNENAIPEEDNIKIPDEPIFKEETVESYKRKRKCGRKQLSEMLPRKKLVIDISETEKHCACGKVNACSQKAA